MIAIIDYKAGNLTSVKLALDTIGVDAKITSDPSVILSSERAIFPGVGAAGSAMANLKQLGLVDCITQAVASGKPFLGICLGTQIIFARSDEDGGTNTLGILPGNVKLFKPADRADKVPQMGWNSVKQTAKHPVWNGINDNSEFYFVHSYYPAPDNKSEIIGTTDYAGVTFASAVARGNLVATQFHIEKSGKVGLKLLKNFCEWKAGNKKEQNAYETNNTVP
jgi:imidazole glycerol-phosphate synthase subunit HisH